MIIYLNIVYTYVHENLLEFCALINPIQTGSVTSNSFRKALLASNCIPVSTENLYNTSLKFTYTELIEDKY